MNKERFQDLERVIYDAARKHLGVEEGGDMPVDITLIDRETHQYSGFHPVPNLQADDDENELALLYASLNVNTAARALDRLVQHNRIVRYRKEQEAKQL